MGVVTQNWVPSRDSLPVAFRELHEIETTLYFFSSDSADGRSAQQLSELSLRIGLTIAKDVAMTPADCVILVGDFVGERVSFNELATQFSWSVRQLPDLAHVDAVCHREPIVAILIQMQSFSEPRSDAIRDLQLAAPGVPLIVCHRAGNKEIVGITDDEVFTTLLSPLKDSELRQTLGFVWAARHRRDPARLCSAGIVPEMRAAAA